MRKSDPATSGVAISSLSQLPKTTSPVAGSSSAASAAKFDFLDSGRISMNLQATTGLNMYNASNASFNGSSSRGMCELLNYTKDIVDRAAQSDRVLCYVQNVMTSSANTAALAGINVYDGSPHVFSLNFGDGSVNKIKMRITKTGDSISDFKMFNCFGGTGTTQTEYQSQTIGTDGSIAMTAKSIGGQSTQTWKGEVKVTGALNSDLKFTSKEMVGKSINADSSTSWSGSSKVTMDQYADHMKFVGFQTGTNGTFSSTSEIFALYELLDKNTVGSAYSLQNLAMGDGSLKAHLVYTGGGSQDTTIEEAWNGDTKQSYTAATSGPYYSAVHAGTVGATESVSIAFAGEEVWDCSGTAEATLVVNQTELDNACAGYGLRKNGDSWINCYTAIGH